MSPTLANSQAYEHLAETNLKSCSIIITVRYKARGMSGGKRIPPSRSSKCLDQSTTSGSLPLRKLSLLNQPRFHPPGARTLSDILTSRLPEHFEIVDILDGEKVPNEPRTRVELDRLKLLVIGFRPERCSTLFAGELRRTLGSLECIHPIRFVLPVLL